jgi:hypothetical protein
VYVPCICPEGFLSGSKVTGALKKMVGSAA